MRRRRTSILSLTAAVSWRLNCQKKLYDGGPRTNFVLVVDGGGGFQGSFEGTKRFGCRLSDIEYDYGTTNGSVFPVSSRT